MKRNRDLVSGWLRKADNDLLTIDAAINVEAYDTACFHAQQAVEKALKAFLIHAGIEFPFTHNLVKLIKLCARTNGAFDSLDSVVEPLTPYAVELALRRGVLARKDRRPRCQKTSRARRRKR